MFIAFLIVLFLLVIYFFYAIFPTRLIKFIWVKRRLREGKKIYLTFDDGPSEYTSMLLDVLYKYDVKASFFCVLKSAEEHPSIIERMKMDGHIVGLHSYDHKTALLMTPTRTHEDFRTSLRVLQNYSTCAIYYRPPWGQLNLSVLKCVRDYDLKLVLWHVMAADWEKDTSSLIIEKKLLSRIKGGDIICLHDGRGKNMAPKKTIEALDRVIPILLERGYYFETINEFFKE